MPLTVKAGMKSTGSLKTKGVTAVGMSVAIWNVMKIVA